MTPYLLLWTLGCAAGFTAGLVVLRMRHALSAKTIVALGFAWEGLIVGSRLHYRLEEMRWPDAIAMSASDMLAPGRRMPLGIVMGAMLAGMWCLVARARWRDVGDALAVAASVMIPIGRIGCALAGCCMGAVCVAWPHALCWRYPPNTEAFTQQVRAGLIGLDASTSLPAHPLPLYFALGSLATLVVLVWLLRRDAAPGVMLATFGILWPLSKLALESLRGKPEPAWLMLGLPTMVLVVTSATLLAAAVRRRWTTGRALNIPVACLVAILVASSASGKSRSSRPASDLPFDERWQHALMQYAQDPQHNRRAIRELRRMDRTQLPPMALLAMADSRLRAKNYASAERLFEQVVARHAGEPWDSYAELGLGWIELVKGRYASAREWFRAVAAAASPSRSLARLLVAFLDARAGDTEAALDTFAEFADRTDVQPALRQAATLAVGYAAYWKGDYDAAAELFDHMVRLWPGGRLTDDARYGAAVAKWRSGARGDARAVFRALAAETNDAGDTAIPSGVLWLEQQSMLGASFDGYRRAPFRAPEEQILDFLDRNGSHMARAFLAAADRADPPARPRVAATRAPLRVASVAEDVEAGAPPVSIAPRAKWMWMLAMGTVGALLLWGSRRVRRGTR
jgi:prolipoprotein diacylglyceryltransferase/outer membrane protein assembly factor BamD (BamD/ComL family)